HKNGSTVHTHCRGFILCNAKGLPNRVISVHTDITDYITRKNVLQSEKERLTYAIEGSQDGVWDWNLATNEVFYSPRWKSILGYEECEVENAFLSWEELLHPDDLAAARQYIQSYLEDTNSSFETRFRMRHKQGHYVPILSRAKKVDIVQGDTTVAHLIGTHVDLSEIMAIQDKLNHQVQLTNTYLNTTNTLLLALDKDGKVTMLNKKGCEILGVTEDSILGKSWFDLPFLPAEILCEYRTKHSYFIDEKLDLGHPIDHPLITAHNDVKMFTWSSALLRDKNAEVIGTLSSAYDITERTKVRNKLEQSEFMLKQAQKLAKIGYYTINLKNDLWSCSTEINELFGINHNHLITTELWFKCIHPEDRQEMHEYFASLIKGKKSEFDKQYRIINQTSHETLWVQGKGFLKFDENGSAIEMFGTIQDISEQLRTKKELILAANVYNNTTEGIVVTDKQGQIIDVNSAFCNITGYSKQEVLGKNPNILNSGIHPSEFYYEMWESIRNTGQWEGEIWNRKKSGETYPEYIKINTIRDANDEVQNYLALFSDISLQKGNEFKLKKMEHYDPLTALPNRVLLSDRLKQSIARANRDNTMLSLAFIDLDGFKQINDSFGTEIGDQVLKIISKRYTKQARVNDTIARIGGDEFIILLDHVETLEESLSFYDRFLEISRQPIELEGHSFNISCSIGISYYPQELPVDSDHLIRQADNAMYQAKLSGKNSYHIFDNEQDQIARERHQKLIEINQAILNDELLLHYQPKVDMRSRKTIGFEALVRWQHPTKGLYTVFLLFTSLYGLYTK
ncbi:MAG: PAS domain S-box protein, partial [Thiomicrorhabdus sp.]|nr:PAS domain S-box protein [Thiomicrorhabdus sp.]